MQTRKRSLTKKEFQDKENVKKEEIQRKRNEIGKSYVDIVGVSSGQQKKVNKNKNKNIFFYNLHN